MLLDYDNEENNASRHVTSFLNWSCERERARLGPSLTFTPFANLLSITLYLPAL